MHPNFIFVGGTRCASKYICNVLSTHPEIYMTKGSNQATFANVHFFNDDRDFSNKYFSQLKNIKQKVGEDRTYYLYMKDSEGNHISKKIYASNPHTKIIISLRNPVDRTFSHFSKLKNEGVIDDNLDLIRDYEKIINFKSSNNQTNLARIITDSLYFNNVKAYLDIFPRKNIKVLFHHDLEKSSGNFFSELFHFLGVDSNFESPVLDHKINTTAFLNKRSNLKSLFYRVMMKLRLYNLAKYFNVKDNSPKINKIKREFLVDVFLEEIINLENLLDIDLNHWKIK